MIDPNDPWRFHFPEDLQALSEAQRRRWAWAVFHPAAVWWRAVLAWWRR